MVYKIRRKYTGKFVSGTTSSQRNRRLVTSEDRGKVYNRLSYAREGLESFLLKTNSQLNVEDFEIVELELSEARTHQLKTIARDTYSIRSRVSNNTQEIVQEESDEDLSEI